MTPIRASGLVAVAAAMVMTASGIGAQTVLDPGWTVSTFSGGFNYPFNGLELDCVSGDFWVTDNRADSVFRVNSLGIPSLWDTSHFPDELALDNGATLLLVQNKGGPNNLYTTSNTFLGGWVEPWGTVTGMDFDANGDFYLGTFDGGEILRYPRSSLPPAVPSPSLWASGLGAVEGIRFSCDDHLFVTDYTGGRVLEAVPPSGPHVVWAAGLAGPLSVAIDPCTGDVFMSTHDNGSIRRASSPGADRLFAEGFLKVAAITFDPEGNLFVVEPGGGRIVKLGNPRPCGSPAANAGGDVSICEGALTTLDGSGSSGCAGGALRYQWGDGVTVLCPWSSTPICDVTPSTTTTYTLDVACDGVCGCTLDHQDTVTVTVGSGTSPVANLAPLDPMCVGDNRTLDASGSTPGLCPGGIEYQFREGAVILRDWDPSPTHGPVSPPGTTVYTVYARCAGTTSCETSALAALIVEPDVVPGDLGNSLRAVRTMSDVASSWRSDPAARGYALYRGIIKGSWPALPHLLRLPTSVATLPDVPAPPSLYFYRVVGESCSGREGP